MSPVEKAKEMLGDEWLESLEAHFLTGFVISYPDAFLMGRPVPLGVDVTHPWQCWPIEQCEAWFVWAAVGRIDRLISLTPFPLPWIGFFRRGRSWQEIHWLEMKWFLKILDPVRVSTCQTFENTLIAPHDYLQRHFQG